MQVSRLSAVVLILCSQQEESHSSGTCAGPGRVLTGKGGLEVELIEQRSFLQSSELSGRKQTELWYSKAWTLHGRCLCPNLMTRMRC